MKSNMKLEIPAGEIGSVQEKGGHTTANISQVQSIRDCEKEIEYIENHKNEVWFNEMKVEWLKDRIEDIKRTNTEKKISITLNKRIKRIEDTQTEILRLLRRKK